MSAYGAAPKLLGKIDIHLPELMHYLYLPISIDESFYRLPPNLDCLLPLLYLADSVVPNYDYVYVSAVRGVASPGNALNRPGWHCDGFGTDDLNVIWWKGEGTRFAVQSFENIVEDDIASLDQFDAQVKDENVITYDEGSVLLLDPFVVHAVPLITKVAPRQFVKISFSNDRYNLEGNSHNYLFDYDWKMVDRAAVRNVTNKDSV